MATDRSRVPRGWLCMMAALLGAARVLRVEEGRRMHQYGYLHLHGVAVHPLSCEGP